MEKARHKYLFTSIDLELNQPSNKVIQIGAVKFNMLTGEVYDRFDRYVKIDETLCTDRSICHIPELTGITDQILEERGVDLVTAYRDLRDFHHKTVLIDGQEEMAMLNPIVWGGDDSRCLKADLERIGYNFSGKRRYCFGHRIFDVKTLSQILCIAQHRSIKGGLKRSCASWGVKFEGRAHSAVVDAHNTAKLAHKLFIEIRGDWDDNIVFKA